MLAMVFEQVVFAMGGEATWLPPLYFGVCSVAYVQKMLSSLLNKGPTIIVFTKYRKLT